MSQEVQNSKLAGTPAIKYTLRDRGFGKSTTLVDENLKNLFRVEFCQESKSFSLMRENLKRKILYF